MQSFFFICRFKKKKKKKAGTLCNMYTKTDYKDLQAHILFTAFVPHTQTHQPFDIKAVQLSPHPCSPSTSAPLCTSLMMSQCVRAANNVGLPRLTFLSPLLHVSVDVSE